MGVQGDDGQYAPVCEWCGEAIDEGYRVGNVDETEVLGGGRGGGGQTRVGK